MSTEYYPFLFRFYSFHPLFIHIKVSDTVKTTSHGIFYDFCASELDEGKHNRSKNIPWDFLYTVSDTFISHLMQTIACIIQEQFSVLHHITCLQISIQASLSVFLNK